MVKNSQIECSYGKRREKTHSKSVTAALSARKKKTSQTGNQECNGSLNLGSLKTLWLTQKSESRWRAMSDTDKKRYHAECSYTIQCERKNMGE